jgi:hypothetical protein
MFTAAGLTAAMFLAVTLLTVTHLTLLFARTTSKKLE